MSKLSALLLTLLCVFAGPAMACKLTDSNLPPEVVKKLEIECLAAEQNLKEKATEAAKGIQAEDVNRYAGMAKEIAEAIGMAATKLGVAVNDFILTPAGILTLAFILMKAFGGTVIKLLMLCLINLVIWRVLKVMWYKQTEALIETPYLFGFFSHKRAKYERCTYAEATEAQVALSLLLVGASIVTCIVIPLNI